MRTMISSVAAAAALTFGAAAATPASAAITTADYAFTSDVGSGTFTLNCDDTQTYPCSLSAFDFSFGGILFDTTNTGIAPKLIDFDPLDGIPPMFFGDYTIGGGAFPDTIPVGGSAPDFLFDFNPSDMLPVSGPHLVTYIPGDGFLASNITISLAAAPPTPTESVPEPGTWAMLLLGFALAGAQLRRAKRMLAPA